MATPTTEEHIIATPPRWSVGNHSGYRDHTHGTVAETAPAHNLGLSAFVCVQLCGRLVSEDGAQLTRGLDWAKERRGRIFRGRHVLWTDWAEVLLLTADATAPPQQGHKRITTDTPDRPRS